MYLDGEAFRAIDGNKSQDFRQKSCTYTNYQSNPWWTADMHSSIFITQVKIWNREDLYSDRLTDYLIYIGDDADYTQNPTCNGGIYYTGSQNVTCNMKGRYITIELKDSNYLQLCEVEAYSTPDYVPPEYGTVNVLQKVTTSQSSLYLDGESQIAVDGNSSQYSTDYSCTETGYDNNAWW